MATVTPRPDNLPSSEFDIQRRVPMCAINHVPPEQMTAGQRRAEVAPLLAHGLVRLRDTVFDQSADPLRRTSMSLAFPAGSSLIPIPTPVNNVHEGVP